MSRNEDYKDIERTSANVSTSESDKDTEPIEELGRRNTERRSANVFHMDGDAFFVGVEVAKNPKLKGKAVVTGADRGIVTAASYEAKALGVSRGLPIFQIKKSFPQVIILPGDYASYVEYSGRMFDIVRRYTEDVEEYSIDECFANLTGWDKPLKMSYREIAERIKKEVRDELDISVSIGVAPTKVLAKVASKWVKPNGLTIMPLENVKNFLSTVPIYKIWGVGPATSQFLMRKGLKTALDFASQSFAWVDNHLAKPYKQIWRELNCITVFHVDSGAKTTYSSIQKTRTFYPPTNDKTFLFSQISKHTEDACYKARHYRLVSKKVSFFLKLQTFRYVRAEIKLLAPTNSPEIILPLIRRELGKIHKIDTPYRATGVTLHDLAGSSVLQADLFGETVRTGKFDVIHEQIDNLEDKFGKRVVHLGSTQGALAPKILRPPGRMGQKPVGTDADDLNRDLLFL
jgi:DNA polymerase-4/DNA polymerase V